MKQKSILEKLTLNAVKIIFISIIGLLLIASIISTCDVTRKEQTVLKIDNIFINFIEIIIFFIAALYINKLIKNLKLTKKIIIICLILWTIITATWIISTQLMPRADQLYIMNAATNLRNNDKIDFQKGNYLDRNPTQIGVVMLLYAFSFIFGNGNYIAIQFVNIPAILLSIYFIYKISKLTFKKRNILKDDKFIILAILAFVPLIFYITFIYGNIYGLLFATIALWLEYSYFEKENIIKILGAAIFSAIAILIKINYLVNLIAMLLLFVYHLIYNKKYKYIIPIIIIPIVCVFIKFELTNYIKNKHDIELSKGVPMIAYIEMGLQKGGFAPGWYNGYNKEIYLVNDCNTEKTKRAVKKDLENTLNNFKNNPVQALKFFALKELSQWNNPNFQSVWVNQNRNHNIEIPKVQNSIIKKGIVYKILNKYMEFYHMIILLGTALYILFEYKNINIQQLGFAIVFIGGYLFHTFWEGKAQYVFTYFILIIPYAVNGLKIGINKLEEFLNPGTTKLLKSKGDINEF